MWNYKEIINLGLKCPYLVCSTCYNQNGLECLEAGQVTYPKYDYAYIIRCEIVMRVCMWKRGSHIPFVAPVIVILVIITKKKQGISKTSSAHDGWVENEQNQNHWWQRDSKERWFNSEVAVSIICARRSMQSNLLISIPSISVSLSLPA